MQKRIVKISVYAIVIILVLTNSVYIRNLSDMQAESSGIDFNAAAFAEKYWLDQIIPFIEKSVEFQDLLNGLKENPDKTFQDYSHALGIGNIRYFMVKGEGIVHSINENDLSINLITEDGLVQFSLATEFVYGNAVRDAVGAINLNEFTNTMNLNNVSAEINKKIRNEIIPPFKEKVETGDRIRYTGAIELNQKYVDLESIELLPVSLEIIQP